MNLFLILFSIFVSVSQAQSVPQNNTATAEILKKLPESMQKTTQKFLDHSWLLESGDFFYEQALKLDSDQKSALIDYLNYMLIKGDLGDKHNSLQAIIFFKDSKSIAFLDKTIQLKDHYISSRAAYAISEFQSKECVLPVLKALEIDSNEFFAMEIYRAALSSLRKLRVFWNFKEVKPYLLKFIVSKDGKEVDYLGTEDALKTLAEAMDPEADELLLEFLINTPKNPYYIALILQTMSQDLVSAALEKAKKKLSCEPSTSYINQTIAGLEMLEDPNSKDRMLKAITIADVKSKTKLIELIGELGTKASVEALGEILVNPAHQKKDILWRDLKYAAIKALSRNQSSYALKVLADWAENSSRADERVMDIDVHDTLKNAFGKYYNKFSDTDRTNVIRIYRVHLKYPSIYIRRILYIELTEVGHPMIDALLQEKEIQELLNKRDDG